MSSYEIRLSISFSICPTLACNELTVYISDDDLSFLRRIVSFHLRIIYDYQF